MCASNYHSYTHFILALGIVREPTVWVLNFITSKHPGIHDIGLPTYIVFTRTPFARPPQLAATTSPSESTFNRVMGAWQGARKVGGHGTAIHSLSVG